RYVSSLRLTTSVLTIPAGAIPRSSAASGRLFAAGRSRSSMGSWRADAASLTRSRGSGIRCAQRVVGHPQLVVGTERLPGGIDHPECGGDSEDDGDDAAGADALLDRRGRRLLEAGEIEAATRCE